MPDFNQAVVSEIACPHPFLGKPGRRVIEVYHDVAVVVRIVDVVYPSVCGPYRVVGIV
jgi:hypothetical protein